MPKAKSLEESVGTAITALFSDDALSYDRVLVQQIANSKGGYIPFRFITGRKVGITDEAVIAHAIRAHAPQLELSEDGRSVRRQAPIPDFTELDSRTVYVVSDGGNQLIGKYILKPNFQIPQERIPIKKPGPVLLTQFGACGPIEKVIIPPEAVNPLSDYAFVVFDSVVGCTSALEKYASSFRPVTVDTNLREYLGDKERETETETNAVVELLGKVRVLSK
ncbi:La- protein 7 [Geranomyces variabilis]|uniref:La- protein 7 n=1 Tax=Geranomyces variabilis TaxID=109894 RepID=A0AAD5XLK2_9FUNG|nr:La- protein 7 [Geranomyces variabilis]